MAGRDPFVPDLVHLGEAADIGEPDIGGEERDLSVPAGQKRVDLGEHLPGLLADRGPRIVGDLPGEIDGVAVHDGLAHARAGSEPLDRH